MKPLKKVDKSKLILDLIFLAVLLLYPMRHVRWGLDLWDTGYNYANFTYMGLDHMDPMWLFSTYLSNAVGHFLTLLPGSGTLMAMNIYTGLFAGGLAVMGYLFCTGKLGIPRGIAFVGEMLALSLCWCPTALLYNYITYVLFTACVILLYIGLTEDKKWCLFAAGCCLGGNVLVRFSNLPEAAMIVAVWAWDIILFLKKERSRQKTGAAILRHTLWCLGGYLAVLAVLLGYIQLRYGLGNYAAGIRRLFAMTENAADYRASSMLTALIRIYTENLYWVVRIGFIIFVGMAGFAVLGFAGKRLCKEGSAAGNGGKIWTVLYRTAQVSWCAVALWMLKWLYDRKVYSFHYFSYDSILRPGILFLMLILLIALIRVFHPASPKEEKLISGMVLLVVLLTSIGSNNGVYPSMNNLFIAGPYALWECWKFARPARDWGGESGWKAWVDLFPAKAVLGAFLAMVLFQSAVFGACFLFEEATGARNITSVIENNEVLKGIRMSPERARWMEELSAYVNESGLKGSEVILFGQVPALSYYLQMPSAFNPWSDLRSYSYETMSCDMGKLAAEITEKGRECPVLILDRRYVQQYEWYREGGDALLEEHEVDANRRGWIAETEKKYQLIQGFIERFNYDLTFENEKFVLYRSVPE